MIGVARPEIWSDQIAFGGARGQSVAPLGDGSIYPVPGARYQGAARFACEAPLEKLPPPRAPAKDRAWGRAGTEVLPPLGGGVGVLPPPWGRCRSAPSPLGEGRGGGRSLRYRPIESEVQLDPVRPYDRRGAISVPPITLEFLARRRSCGDRWHAPLELNLKDSMGLFDASYFARISSIAAGAIRDLSRLLVNDRLRVARARSTRQLARRSPPSSVGRAPCRPARRSSMRVASRCSRGRLSR